MKDIDVALMKHHVNARKNNRIVFATFLQGSQNYELDTPESDIDTKSLIIPSIDDIVRNRKPISTTSVMPDDSHNDLKDIRVMFRTFEKQNINFLEVLFTEHYWPNLKFDPEVQELRAMADEVAAINPNQLYRCISGMSQQKYHALEHPYPTIVDKIEKYGYDPKQLHHIIRMNEFIHRLAGGDNFRDCLVPYRKEYLIEVKQGAIGLEEARHLAKKYDEDTHLTMKSLTTREDVINTDTIEKLYELLTTVIKKSVTMEVTSE